MAVEQIVTPESRLIAMREAIDHVKDAAASLRSATLGFVDVDCNGAVDVASHALYEVHKATELLEAQYLDLLKLEESTWA